MNWKALLAVVTLVVLIYSPTWVPAASRTLRSDRLAATQSGARDAGSDTANETAKSHRSTSIAR